MFRLMYASGLRRNELCNLLQTDIETQDGKFRIRINNGSPRRIIIQRGKGGKDRYTVLSKTVVEELRAYYLSCRPAISNYRIVKVDNTDVTFRYLDRKYNKTALRRVKGEDFIALFLQHVLPKGFVKIRHYGFLASRSKKEDLPRIQTALNVGFVAEKEKLSTREVILKTTGIDPYKCPKCKKGMMVVVKITPGNRGSPSRRFAPDSARWIGIPRAKLVKLEP